MKYKLSYNAPKTETELLKKTYRLTGIKLIDFLKPFNSSFSESYKKSSGYFGKAMEIYLGASANNLPIPDFPNLNIELKTLPLNKNMFPKNSVKICSTSFFPIKTNSKWETSILKLKLKKILWIPFESDKDIPIDKRKICHPFLFNLKNYENIIKKDYENIIELLFTGKIEYIFSNIGKYLILKPTSSNKRLTSSFNSHGELIKTNFIGFYLNQLFLKKIMYENLHL